jgi:uroporphyrinogen-III synthase
MAADRPRVLVTRPAGQAGALCRLLADAGYTPVEQPLLELTPLAGPDAAQRRLLGGMESVDHVIFVSANAVRFGMAWIESCWPSLPPVPHWYAVGGASAALLAAHGVQPQTPRTTLDSEGLLALPALRAVRGQRVLLVRGEGGRTHLRDTLESRGARVCELVCYRRSCPALAPGRMAGLLAQVAAVLISSGEGLGNMLALLSPAETSKFRTMPLVVPSQRVAGMAAAAGFCRVFRATSAADAAMLEALQRAIQEPENKT